MVNDSGIVTCLDAKTGDGGLDGAADRQLLGVADRGRRARLLLQRGRQGDGDRGRPRRSRSWPRTSLDDGLHGVAGGRRPGALPADEVAPVSDREPAAVAREVRCAYGRFTRDRAGRTRPPHVEADGRGVSPAVVDGPGPGRRAIAPRRPAGE